MTYFYATLIIVASITVFLGMQLFIRKLTVRLITGKWAHEDRKAGQLYRSLL